MSGLTRPPSSGRLLNFNSTRTAWLLSLLIGITLTTQFVLMFYHDEIVLELYSFEEDLAAVNSMATDVVNDVYDYNNDGERVEVQPQQHIAANNDIDNAREGGSHDTGVKGHVQTDVGRNITKYSNYSMEPIEILKRAGVDHTAGYVPSITGREARAAMKDREKRQNLRQEAVLPPVEDIQAMYGNHSYIHGLERCAEFRDTVMPEYRLMGPAGLFNSATNLLNKLLRLNCSNEARARTRKYKNGVGMMLQAPWGKHNPASWRLHHEAGVGGKGVIQKHFLPIVMIKDPVTWMASMCRHPYEARWRHTSDHCPNLVPNKYDRGRVPGKGTMGLKVKFATKHIGAEPIPDSKNKTFVQYDSLVDLWNTWYNQWHDVTFPRLMVRFEDLMFHAEETVSEVCACGGGTMKPKFRYVEDSAKGDSGPHAGSAGFLASLITYGNLTLRMEGILKDSRDLEYAREHLDKDLMQMFGYAPL